MMRAFRTMLSRLDSPGTLLTLTVTLTLAAPVQGQQSQVLEGRSFRSEALARELEYSVYLPSGYQSSEQSYLTVYLLHGYGGDHTDWIRRGDASTTTDSGAFESAIVEDLIPRVNQGACRSSRSAIHTLIMD